MKMIELLSLKSVPISLKSPTVVLQRDIVGCFGGLNNLCAFYRPLRQI